MFNFIDKLFKKNKKTSKSKNINKLAIQYALDAETERKLGNFEVALSYIRTAIEKDCNNDMFYITQALIYKDKKDFDNAFVSINKAIELNDKIILTKEIKEEILKNLYSEI